MNTSDAIDLIQPHFAARLASLAYFSDIYIAAPRLWKDGEKLHTPKSINEKIAQALTGLIQTNGKIGAAVRVFQPTLSMEHPSGREGELVLVTRCETHPVLNHGTGGTHKHVSRIAYEVLRAGTGFTLLQGFCTLRADGVCFEPCLEAEKFETVDVILKARVAVSPLTACETPTLTQAGNLVTLTNLTAGATIYYSTDTWIFPAPQVPGAQIYAAPITVPSGTQLRWAAYLDGYAGSNVGFAQL